MFFLPPLRLSCCFPFQLDVSLSFASFFVLPPFHPASPFSFPLIPSFLCFHSLLHVPFLLFCFVPFCIVSTLLTVFLFRDGLLSCFATWFPDHFCVFFNFFLFHMFSLFSFSTIHFSTLSSSSLLVLLSSLSQFPTLSHFISHLSSVFFFFFGFCLLHLCFSIQCSLSFRQTVFQGNSFGEQGVETMFTSIAEGTGRRRLRWEKIRLSGVGAGDAGTKAIAKLIRDGSLPSLTRTRGLGAQRIFVVGTSCPVAAVLHGVLLLSFLPMVRF